MSIIHRLDKRITEELDIEIAPTSQVQKDIISIATELLDQISDLELKLNDSRIKISHFVEQLNASLGTEVRKQQPRLNVSHSDGACRIGYKSKEVAFRPDLKRKKWCTEGRYGRRFAKTYPEVLPLSGNVNPIANAVVDFFAQNYNSLR